MRCHIEHITKGNELSFSVARLSEGIAELRMLTTLSIDISKNPLVRSHVQIIVDKLSKTPNLEVFHLTMREVPYS